MKYPRDDAPPLHSLPPDQPPPSRVHEPRDRRSHPVSIHESSNSTERRSPPPRQIRTRGMASAGITCKGLQVDRKRLAYELGKNDPPKDNNLRPAGRARPPTSATTRSPLLCSHYVHTRTHPACKDNGSRCVERDDARAITIFLRPVCRDCQG